MKSRAEIQAARELFALEKNLDAHNRLHGLSLKVISRPDPPDAVLSDGSITTWMELTDVFFSDAWARDLSSYASVKGHEPMASGQYLDMDKQLAENFCNQLIKKATKKSYKRLIQQYGPGILVVGLESPWLDNESIDEIEEEWRRRGSFDLSETFAHIYLWHRTSTSYKTFAWPRLI